MRRLRVCFAVVGILWSAAIAAAQVTSSAGAASADEPPSIRLGAEIFPDFTYTLDPRTLDADNNSVRLSQFNVSRARLNVTGNLSPLIAFRVTPDVARETSSFSSLAGSVELRLVYAYLQLNLDKWMPANSYARFGFHDTPWLEFAESIYRYRFQGPMFAEREGYLVLTDAGASFHAALPSNYGDVHVGVYNGEGASKAEVNGAKAFQVRGTLRPFASPSAPAALRGIRGSIFYDADRYVRDGPRNRLIGSVTLEHPHLNASFELLKTTDRTSITRPEIGGNGYSFWATPRVSGGLEGLVRYDRMTPNTRLGAQVRARTIVGIAYWFPMQGAVSSALLLDYDSQTFESFVPGQPRQTRMAVHGLIGF